MLVYIKIQRAYNRIQQAKTMIKVLYGPRMGTTKLSMDDHPKKGENHGENHWGKWENPWNHWEIIGKTRS